MQELDLNRRWILLDAAWRNRSKTRLRFGPQFLKRMAIEYDICGRNPMARIAVV